MLYNLHDTPMDLYDRMRLNIELNEELGIRIFSFPMRYQPTDMKDRSHVGTNWNKYYLRSMRLILHATHGIVSDSGRRRPYVHGAVNALISPDPLRREFLSRRLPPLHVRSPSVIGRLQAVRLIFAQCMLPLCCNRHGPIINTRRTSLHRSESCGTGQLKEPDYSIATEIEMP